MILPSTTCRSAFAGRRLVGAVIIAGFLLAAVVLLWTDRAGSAFTGVTHSLRRSAGRVERFVGVDIVDRSDIPYAADDLVHAAFWAAGMIVIGWVLRRRLSVSKSALFVGGTSLLFELAQPLFSATRAFEPSDVLANLIGVGTGAIFLFVVLWGLNKVFKQ